MQNQQDTRVTKVTNIGLLVVHGVGEQGQFEHLQEVAKRFVLALENQNSNKREEIYVHINKQNSGPLGANQQTWQDVKSAPIIIKIKDNLLNKTTWIHLREVWWADIDPPSSPRKAIEFWFWGLSLWLTPNSKQLFKESLTKETEEKSKKEYSIPLYVRVEYFGIAILFYLVQPILSFLNWVLQLVGISFPINIFSQYMSKVRLYLRKAEKGKGPLQDLNNPPRYSVRRRMISALVKMAASKYDRWYILSHSLGAIVAFNGLSETEEKLANYLDEPTWKLASKKGLTRDDSIETQTSNNSQNLRNVKPSRPPWLKSEDRIYRKKLFDKLEGLVTYGAPFQHFINLSPSIILGDKDTSGFHKNFKWFNIYDPSDPVASQAEQFFQNTNIKTDIRPTDILYKAQGYHLLSHIKYLDIDKNCKDTLVDRILFWIRNETRGISNTLEESRSSRWLKKDDNSLIQHRIFSFLLWWIGGYIGACLICLITTVFLKQFIDFNWIENFSIESIFTTYNKILNIFLKKDTLLIVFFNKNAFHEFSNILVNALVYVFLALGIAGLAGIVRWVVYRESPKVLIREYIEDNVNYEFSIENILEEFNYNRKIVKNILDKLVKEKIIRKYESENQYFYVRREIIVEEENFLISIIDKCKQKRCPEEECQELAQNLCESSYCQLVNSFCYQIFNLIYKALIFEKNVYDSIIITDVGKEINYKNVWSIYLKELEYEFYYQICQKNNFSPQKILILKYETAIKIKELLELKKGGKSI